jgi:hypothetical protein
MVKKMICWNTYVINISSMSNKIKTGLRKICQHIRRTAVSCSRTGKDTGVPSMFPITIKAHCNIQVIEGFQSFIPLFIMGFFLVGGEFEPSMFKHTGLIWQSFE